MTPNYSNVESKQSLIESKDAKFYNTNTDTNFTRYDSINSIKNIN